MTDTKKSEIYLAYRDKVFGYLRSHLGDTTAAEDLCSDVFLKVYEKLDSFDEKRASVSTWIYTITRNTLTDYFRTRHVADEIPESFRDDVSVEDDICRDEMLETLADALETLDERSRDIIILHYYRGMTLRTIALRLDISYAYVRILHQKAIGVLKKFFPND